MVQPGRWATVPSMRTAAVLLVVSLTGVTASALISQNPDFSGTWLATKDAPSTVEMAPSAVFGERFGLQQEGGRMTMLRAIRGRATALTNVFATDGSEHRVMASSRSCFGQSGQILTLAWDAGALKYTIAGSIPAGGGTPTKLNAVFTFRKMDADTVVVESMMRDAATGKPKPVGTVYKRSAETLTPEPAAPAPTTPATIAQVAWISGDWVSERGTAPSVTTTEERWSPANGGAMIATSRTVRGGAMTEFEFLCLFERNGTLVYTAMPNAGAGTDFTLTKVDAESATFENPTHDFPKVIRYAKRADGGMEAIVSGAPGSRAITFIFRKK